MWNNVTAIEGSTSKPNQNHAMTAVCHEHRCLECMSSRLGSISLCLLSAVLHLPLPREVSQGVLRLFSQDKLYAVQLLGSILSLPVVAPTLSLSM